MASTAQRSTAAASGLYQRAAIEDYLATLPADAPVRSIVAGESVEASLVAFERADARALAEQARFRRWGRRGLYATTFGILVGALLLLPLEHRFGGTPRLVIGGLQTLALAITFGATLTIRWLKPRDHWITFRAEAERLRSRIFDTILFAAPPAGSDAAATASQRLGLTMSAFVNDQMKFFKKRAVQHGRVASHLSPLRIFGYLLILAAGILGIAAVVNGLGVPLPAVLARTVDLLLLPDASRWQLGITTMASGILAHATSRGFMEEDERKAALYKVTFQKLQQLVERSLPQVQAACAKGDETSLRQFFSEARLIMEQEHAVWTLMRPTDAAALPAGGPVAADRAPS